MVSLSVSSSLFPDSSAITLFLTIGVDDMAKIPYHGFNHLFSYYVMLRCAVIYHDIEISILLYFTMVQTLQNIVTPLQF